jgi:hypothetical protein
MNKLFFLFFLGGCSYEPTINPAQCQDICAPQGVCEYSDDRNGGGFCTCRDGNGECPLTNTTGGILLPRPEDTSLVSMDASSETKED